ncbi:unnamed protein product [Linum tenue]|uniref:MADS-box domain-containing protein n=1 Tax=Linum tenue TaxID=586396 RepID=A0AAV0IMM4_9ROSI|nr:unnamed protein product [Linum tenue]
MARKRVKLAWIPNESARRSTMRNRRQSLVKKVRELSILCGVPTFFIVYSQGEPEPTVWPPTREEAERLLARFLALPAVEQTRKTTNQESYLRDMLNKLRGVHRQQLQVLNELELAYLMDQVHYTSSGLEGLDLYGLNRLSVLLDEKLREVRKKAEYFEVELKGSAAGTNVGNNVVVPENPNLSWQEEDFVNHIINQDGGDGNGGDVGFPPME